MFLLHACHNKWTCYKTVLRSFYGNSLTCSLLACRQSSWPMLSHWNWKCDGKQLFFVYFKQMLSVFAALVCVCVCVRLISTCFYCRRVSVGCRRRSRVAATGSANSALLTCAVNLVFALFSSLFFKFFACT